MPFFIALVSISCADLSQNSDKKKIQNDINQAFEKSATNLSNCATTHKIFERLNSDEVRLDVKLVINENGRMDKFTLEDDKSYQSEFIDCIFSVLDKIQFPKSHTAETIELDQPFVFKK